MCGIFHYTHTMSLSTATTANWRFTPIHMLQTVAQYGGERRTTLGAKFKLLYSEISLSLKPFGIRHMYIYTFLLSMTDTVTSQNIDLSSWDTRYNTTSTIHNGYYNKQITRGLKLLNLRRALYILMHKAVILNTWLIVRKFLEELWVRSAWSVRPYCCERQLNCCGVRNVDDDDNDDDDNNNNE